MGTSAGDLVTGPKNATNLLGPYIFEAKNLFSDVGWQAKFFLLRQKTLFLVASI
jgi:hypothetical protein